MVDTYLEGEKEKLSHSRKLEGHFKNGNLTSHTIFSPGKVCLGETKESTLQRREPLEKERFGTILKSTKKKKKQNEVFKNFFP